jgi:hypothetical protein
MRPTNQGVGEKQWFSTRCLEKRNCRWQKHKNFVSTACEIAWTIDILHLCLHPRKNPRTRAPENSVLMTMSSACICSRGVATAASREPPSKKATNGANGTSHGVVAANRTVNSLSDPAAAGAAAAAAAAAAAPLPPPPPAGFLPPAGATGATGAAVDSPRKRSTSSSVRVVAIISCGEARRGTRGGRQIKQGYSDRGEKRKRTDRAITSEAERCGKGTRQAQRKIRWSVSLAGATDLRPNSLESILQF